MTMNDKPKSSRLNRFGANPSSRKTLAPSAFFGLLINGLQVRVLPGSPLIPDGLTPSRQISKNATAGTSAGTRFLIHIRDVGVCACLSRSSLSPRKGGEDDGTAGLDHGRRSCVRRDSAGEPI